MNVLSQLLFKTRVKQKLSLSAKTTLGFTMIELLVGMIIASLIITPMLAFVVDILNRDLREQAKSNTEQDLQAAVDYIAQDMSQSIYIYTNDEDRANNQIAEILAPTGGGTPSILTGAEMEGEPKLVFWKRKYEENAVPLDPSDSTITCPDDGDASCNDTFVYSLVAYYLVDDDDSTWCQPQEGDYSCPKRLARLEISDKARGLDGNYVPTLGAVDTDGNGDLDAPGNGFNPSNVNNYETPLSMTRGNEDLEALNGGRARVLVNYVDDLILNSVENNKVAQITIVGNAKRRIPGQFKADGVTDGKKDLICTAGSSPYCPTATAQVGARSGFGTSE